MFDFHTNFQAVPQQPIPRGLSQKSVSPHHGPLSQQPEAQAPPLLVAPLIEDAALSKAHTRRDSGTLLLSGGDEISKRGSIARKCVRRPLSPAHATAHCTDARACVAAGPAILSDGPSAPHAKHPTGCLSGVSAPHLPVTGALCQVLGRSVQSGGGAAHGCADAATPVNVWAKPELAHRPGVQSAPWLVEEQA